ncbi:hypothetical protein PQZ50_02550 [Methylophilaceae bacterium]|nr:hypothetical protein [Methylophilaceae bacterium]
MSKPKNDDSSGGWKLISAEDDDGSFIEGEEVNSLILDKLF